MTCYICSATAKNSVRVHDSITFSYCEEHSNEVTVGVMDYVLKGNLDRLIKFKNEYANLGNGAVSKEFEKFSKMETNWMDNDSSVTEQPI